MKKILALLLAVIIMALSQPVFASERKWADNSLENMDGLAAKFGIIHLADNKNHATRDTHGWLIIDAEIINYAIENLIIEDVLSAQLIYQDKYVFTAQTDFSQKVIQPLVSLKGRLIFEVPVLVYESTPENFKIEIFIEGEVYPFLIPAAGNDTALDDKSFEPIEVGTKGALVLAVQEKLVEMGLISGTPDGHYGNYTAGAVKELQRRHGMPQTGICDYDFLVNVLEIDPDEVSVIPVSKPDIKIESSVYQQDGMTIINDSNITFKWMSEGQVESYAVNLLYEDGTRFSLGTTKDTSKTVPTWQLQPGLYKLFVGATPMGGTSEDTVWNELCFSVPGSNSAEQTPVPALQITYIDAASTPEDIQTVQMALYKYGLLNADGITPGILDQGTLQAVSAFQQKVNNIFGSGLYVIDPTTDAYIDNATIDYLLHREINFQDASE